MTNGGSYGAGVVAVGSVSLFSGNPINFLAMAKIM